jgi:hypothetical protein
MEASGLHGECAAVVVRNRRASGWDVAGKDEIDGVRAARSRAVAVVRSTGPRRPANLAQWMVRYFVTLRLASNGSATGTTASSSR